jgi:hypothetical protein
MSAPLSEAEAAPLKLLLGAKSKGIVDKIVSEVFKQLHAPLDKRALIEQSLEQALSLAAADAYEEKKKKKKKKRKTQFFFIFRKGVFTYGVATVCERRAESGQCEWRRN